MNSMSDAGIPSWCVRGAQVTPLVEWGDGAADPAIRDPDGVLQYPKMGEVYTIRRVKISYVSEYSEIIVGILLNEISNPLGGEGSCLGDEMAFDVKGFGPVKRVAVEQRVEEHA